MTATDYQMYTPLENSLIHFPPMTLLTVMVNHDILHQYRVPVYDTGICNTDLEDYLKIYLCVLEIVSLFPSTIQTNLDT